MGSEWGRTRLLRGVPPLGAGGGGDAHDPHRPARARTHVRGEPARVAVPDALSSGEASGGWEEGDRVARCCFHSGSDASSRHARPRRAPLRWLRPRPAATRSDTAGAPRRTQPGGPWPRSAATRRDTVARSDATGRRVPPPFAARRAVGAPRHRARPCRICPPGRPRPTATRSNRRIRPHQLWIWGPGGKCRISSRRPGLRGEIQMILKCTPNRSRQFILFRINIYMYCIRTPFQILMDIILPSTCSARISVHEQYINGWSG